MEPEQIRSSVIARLVGFDELQRPPQTAAKKQSFLSDNYHSKVAIIGMWGEKYSSKQYQEKMGVVSRAEVRKREEHPKGYVSTGKKKSSSGFLVTPTKELFCAYLQKPTSFTSKHVIDAQATPPHRRGKGMKLTGSHLHGKMANHGNFGRRVDQQKLKSNLKPKHRNHVNPVKPQFRKKQNSLRCFSPVSSPRASHFSDKKTGQLILLGNKAEERKKLLDGTTPSGEKNKFSWDVNYISMVSISRDMGLSLGKIGSERLAAEVKLSLTSSPRLTSKDGNDDSLHCSGIHPESQTSSEEGNQPSPVSVLEPIFDGEMLEDLEKLSHLNFLGLEQQLESLKSESVETYSEGPGMVVSSDDESEESILDSETKENKDNEPIGSLGVQESRDSSYIDNVLAEADLGNRKTVSKWDSVDLPINPMIFEKLEKKFAKQTSWKRSERRLLFDRVNSGLVEILETFTGAPTWKKPVSRRLGTALNTQWLKEELQKLLAMQEKRAKKGSSGKVPVAIESEKWLELEADVEPVVWELQAMLVDELLAEFVDIV